MSMRLSPAKALRGTVLLPPDKSIAHRAMLFASLGEGVSEIHNFPSAADPQSTKSCVEALGIEVREENGVLFVHGKGMHGWRAPFGPLDCGNSGTTMRMLAGLLAGRNFDTELIGDASLSRRPMRRVTAPLAEMGAQIATTDGHAPLHITGTPALRGITYRLPMASAQVKSCVLLAGMLAQTPTTVLEPVLTRDHTERMLGLIPQEVDGVRAWVMEPGFQIAPQIWRIPRDFSAAAFFLVAGSIVPDSEILLPAVGLNPTRTALLDVLRRMGAQIEVLNPRMEAGEPVGDLLVTSAPLTGVVVEGAEVANLIDEVPVLSVAAACAQGEMVIRNADELRVKETDRIAAMTKNLRKLGAQVEELPDGMRIQGQTRWAGAHVEAFDDHRIAMAMGVASLVNPGVTLLDDPDCARISFPTFWDVLQAMTL